MTTSDPSEHQAERLCPNCGGLAGDQYCGSCGQAVSPKDRIGDLIREWITTTISADGILFGTLAQLIVAPGDVTRSWWAHKRIGLMSPVRTLLTVILFGSILAWVQSRVYQGTGGSIGLIVSAFTYQIAIVTSLVVVAALPKLLPHRLRRTTYEYATFALYESAFLALVAWAFLLVLIVAGIFSTWVSTPFWTGSPVLPLVAMGIAAHAIWHLKTAFGLSWWGAVARAIVLGAATFIASLVVSFVLMTTGLSELWSPAAAFSDEPLPRFEDGFPGA